MTDLPPSTSLIFTESLENRLATVSAGLSLTLFVFVILTGQVGLYFWKAHNHRRDALWIKGIVTFIWVMQALEVALACHMAVLAHGNDSVMPEIVVKKWLWEWAAYTGICVTTECLVHAFFISRIYLLETNPVCVRVSIVLCTILVLEGAFGFTLLLHVIIVIVEESKIVIFYWPLPLWLGLSILADVSIAGSIWYILQKGYPYVSVRLNLLIKRLVKFCIQTGLITSLATGITVALWIVAELDPGHLFMSFPLSGIYAACFMANLVARESYFYHIQTDGDTGDLGMATSSIAFATHESSGKNESVSSRIN